MFKDREWWNETRKQKTKKGTTSKRPRAVVRRIKRQKERRYVKQSIEIYTKSSFDPSWALYSMPLILYYISYSASPGFSPDNKNIHNTGSQRHAFPFWKQESLGFPHNFTPLKGALSGMLLRSLDASVMVVVQWQKYNSCHQMGPDKNVGRQSRWYFASA